MSYKNFVGSVKYDDREEILYGKIEAIDDLVTYEGKDIAGLKAAFHEAVEDYLHLCRGAGKKPGKSFKGSLNIRLSEKLHREAAIKAAEKGITLNQLIRESVEKYIT